MRTLLNLFRVGVSSTVFGSKWKYKMDREIKVQKYDLISVEVKLDRQQLIKFIFQTRLEIYWWTRLRSCVATSSECRTAATLRGGISGLGHW